MPTPAPPAPAVASQAPPTSSDPPFQPETSSTIARHRERITGRNLLLYDGHCGLCNRVVRFCALRDPGGQLLYAPLQSQLARDLLAKYHQTPEALESAALFLGALTPAERFYHHSDAVAQALRQLRSPWKTLGRLLWFVPRLFREPFYNFIGRIRYRVFGKYSHCPVPPPHIRNRFLGLDDPGCA